MVSPQQHGFFITGSDTDVGKTYIACELLRQLQPHHELIETRKPAESGCTPGEAGELTTHDADALRLANGARESIGRIAAFRFRAALAPHRAARLESRRLMIDDLAAACQRDQPASLLLVEGAGGFYSPLAEDGLNADLASRLQLPVVIVVDDRIGAVNQALMTIQAVESRQLDIAMIILNQVSADHEAGMDNAGDLAPYCRYPVFRCAYGASLPGVFEAGQ